MKETRLPIVAVVGRPNVGKSTLFNRLIGKRTAIESDTPGTTRDRLYDKVSWIGNNFYLVDTAGLMDFKKKAQKDLDNLVKDNVFEAIEEADLILFVVDYSEGITQLDQSVATLLRRSKKEVILAVNKCDNLDRILNIDEYSRLGNFSRIGVSAIQKKNLGDLLDLIVKKLKPNFNLQDIPTNSDNELSLAILGRPNVGKSTLFNSFSKTRKMIVSNTPGTTRDSQSEQFTYSGQKINIIDTAGMARAGKSGRGIEKFSLIRTLQAIDQADIAVILMDALEGSTHLDQKIAGFVAEAGKGIILAINKIDQLENPEADKAELIYRFKEDFNFLPYAPVVFVSALNQENINVILNQVIKIAEARSLAVDSNELTELAQLMQENFGQLPKIASICQTGQKPPRFEVTVKNVQDWHFSFNRFLENRLRDNFGFQGTPIKISLRSKIKQ